MNFPPWGVQFLCRSEYNLKIHKHINGNEERRLLFHRSLLIHILDFFVNGFVTCSLNKSPIK